MLSIPPTPPPQVERMKKETKGEPVSSTAYYYFFRYSSLFSTESYICFFSSTGQTDETRELDTKAN